MEKKKEKKKSSTKTTKTNQSVKEDVVVSVETKEVSKPEAAKKETKPKKISHFLFKALAISILVAVVISWIIPAGTFSGSNLTTTEPARTGINELFLSMFYASNYYLLQVVFILVLGLFY